MRYAPIVGLVMALALLAGALPAQAQGGNPAVTHEGDNIYLVDGSKGPIPNLLPAEEVHKIRELVFSTPGSLHRVVSPVSPDDQTVLVRARTTAACGESSHSEKLLKLLASAALYRFDGNDLAIELMADGGTLDFVPLP